MRCLVVIMVLLSDLAIAAQPAGHVSELEPTLETVDREMIELLLLRDDQIDGYLNVIQTQRKALAVLSDAQWQKQLELYKGTIEMLRPVLNDVQLAQFSAYLGCLIVEREYDAQLSMETNVIGKTE